MTDLVKWNRDPFEDFDRLFNNLFPSGRRRVQSVLGDDYNSFMGFDLAVDVYEKDNQVIAEMNLPGINPDDVDIEVQDGMLKISGERKLETEEKDKQGNYHRREIRRGSFSRVVTLPENADTDSVDANYKDGVLRIEMKKLPESESKSKKIKIKRD